MIAVVVARMMSFAGAVAAATAGPPPAAAAPAEAATSAEAATAEGRRPPTTNFEAHLEAVRPEVMEVLLFLLIIGWRGNRIPSYRHQTTKQQDIWMI